MPTNLLRLIPSGNSADRVEVQDTRFTTDVVGRYVCSTWDEATGNGGVAFDAVVIGAGMFGAYCAEKLYRNANLRVLVLDAGPVLVTEHVQNLSRIGLDAPGPKPDPQNPKQSIPVATNADDPGPRARVWGIPWRSNVPFPGLAYCLGGRSLYWGGWSPRLTAADLARWPQEIRDQLQNSAGLRCDPNPTPGAAPVDEYCRTERETGVVPSGDYISKELEDALRAKMEAVRATVPALDAIEDAPLAVQAEPPASGLFSFDKWSSAPIFVDAVREDIERAIRVAGVNSDWQRRLFFVPRVHVARLLTTGSAVTGIEAWEGEQRRFLAISPRCAVVLAAGTIESTRLALASFPTPLMGRNLMAHLRTNTTVRIHRSALGLPLTQPLQAAALLVRGSTPDGRFHLQVTAAAVPKPGGSEDTMWRAVPDIDLLERMLQRQREDWVVITLRGIGEMQGDRDPNRPKVTGAPPSWVDLSDQTETLPPFSAAPAAQVQRAWVNLVAGDADKRLWKAMDLAALALAHKLANDDPKLIEGVDQQPDGLGTTHHEAGTLWMGTDPSNSVTDLDGKFHHVSNGYVAGPALFPTLGSANPSLTALTLARRTAHAILRKALVPESDFEPLGSGGLDGWQQVGSGRFVELGGNIVEVDGGPGILWYPRTQFEDFVLRVDFRLSSPTDNSGVFLRFPDPGGNADVPVRQGYEVQIDNTGYNPDTNTFDDPLHRTGAIYGLAPASGPLPSVQQWHTYEIEAIGRRITVRLDGQEVSQLANASRSPRGYIGLQAHHAGSKVQFARVRVRDLKPLAAGIQPLKVKPSDGRHAPARVGPGAGEVPAVVPTAPEGAPIKTKPV
jgi:choline dehydrogenase-like flavoprotein